MSEEIINKVANSGLITLDLETLIPLDAMVELDISAQLFQGLVVKEKLFRDFVSGNDWTIYRDKYVAVFCSVDAIIPTWAYMLLASALQPYAIKIVYGRRSDLINETLNDIITNFNVEEYKGQRVIVKGCSKESISMNIYMQLVQKLQPHVKSIMFGEPCSTVPVYKKPNI